MGTNLNCWDFMKCGRERGGAKSNQMGVCKAYTRQAGQACWLVAGTLCGGTVQGSYAQKKSNCMVCDFYKQFDLTHRSRVREKFGA